MLALGEFDTENYNADGKVGEAKYLWFLFFCATFLSYVTYFNMLVNLMGETLSEILNNEKTAAKSEQIRILADFAFMVKAREDYASEKHKKKNFFFVARRTNVESRFNPSDKTDYQEINNIVSVMGKSLKKDQILTEERIMNELSEIQARIHPVEHSIDEQSKLNKKLDLILDHLSKNED